MLLIVKPEVGVAISATTGVLFLLVFFLAGAAQTVEANEVINSVQRSLFKVSIPQQFFKNNKIFKYLQFNQGIVA